jgi:hypothetical protein
MTVEQIAQRLSALPPEKQQQALEFIEELQKKSEMSKKPWKSLRGALAHYNFDVPEEAIAEMRREAWKNFPRDFK